jgi:carbamate kinase
LKILVALGGNAILQHGEKGSAAEQLANVRKTCRELVRLIMKGHHIAITHGNGPQVGDILLKNEIAKDSLPPMPLDVCGAESQGMIGYMIQQSMYAELLSARLDKTVATVVTQAEIDANDPTLNSPTKPIGPFYTAVEASKLRDENGWKIIDDSGRGYRRVVPSPNPIAIVEGPIIKQLFDDGVIVIAAGGGGVPVIRTSEGRDNVLGVEAVIDKDHSAALLASSLETEILLMLTDVERVSLNFGRSDERKLDKISVEECKTYLAEGQFPAGSMGPKIESAVRFLESGGSKAIITSLEMAEEAIAGRAGTVITRA